MKRVTTILLAAASVACMNPLGAEVCSDIASMMKVLDTTAPTLAHPFAVTGTVHSATGSTFVFDDGEQLITVLNRTDPYVDIQTGNRVVLSGNFGLQKVTYGNEPYTVAFKGEVLDTGTPPQPADRTLQELSNNRDNLRLIRTTGTLIDYRIDDADPDYLQLILKDGPTTIPVSILSQDTEAADRMIDARVSVIGTFNRTVQGVRRYSRPMISSSAEDIKVVATPPALDDIPVLERKIYLTPKDVLSLSKRKVAGEIIAVWQKHNLLLKDADDRIVRVRLSNRDKTSPRAGLKATICGYPETDQFNIILGTATIASCADEAHASETPEPVPSPSDIILHTPNGTTVFKPSYYGKLIKIRGTVRNLPPPDSTEGRIGLDCNGHLIHLDASACLTATEDLELGCTIDASGVCLFEMNDYDVQTDTPHVSGLALVLRGEDDVTIVSRPPWMTPFRFLVILAAMAGITLLVLIWNFALRTLVERRGRELARKQAETLKAKLKTVERTRLATELHDAVVQNLTGAALEIRAAMATLGEADAEAAPHLDIALKTINSSRAELRNCIWDLRNRALEEKSVDEAIRITVQPHLGDTKIQVRFNVSRRKIPDNELHHILSIIRELVINAVRHGQAKSIKVAGTLDQGRILFSVTDDGCGFDPAAAPGMEQGHFGVEGVTERAKSLDGSAVITSEPGKGTRVSVTVALLEETK